MFHYVILQQIQNKEKSSSACAVAVNFAFAHDNCQYCRHLSQRVATESLEASACRAKFALTHSEKTSAFARQHSSAFAHLSKAEYFRPPQNTWNYWETLRLKEN
jgi:hypothetical protein